MKKILAILLALVAIGSFAVAEDAPKAALTGYTYFTTNLYDQDGQVSSGPDWVSNGHYSTLGLAYSGGMAGFSATIEFENNAVNSAFRDYTAWVKPFGDILKVSAGRLRNGDYRLTSYIDGSGFNTRLANAESGLLVQVYPVAGLSIGAFVPAGDTAVDFADVDFGFGAAYTIDKVAKIVAAYKMSVDELFIGADVKAVDGLTLKIGFVNDSTTAADFNRIWATAAYNVMEPLEVSLDTYYKLETTAAVNTLWVKGQVAYTLNDTMTPSAYVSFKNVDAPSSVNTIGFGGQFAVTAATGGAIYLGFDYEKAGSAAGTWAIPLSVEVSF